LGDIQIDPVLARPVPSSFGPPPGSTSRTGLKEVCWTIDPWMTSSRTGGPATLFRSRRSKK
jgi:hypothetical protein